MEENFWQLNQLINYINEELKPNPRIRHVYLDDEATFEDNSNRFIARVEEVQRVIGEIDQELAAMLEPNLYKEIKSPNMDFKERLRKANTALTIGFTAAGIALVGVITGGALLAGGVTAMTIVGTGAAATMKVGFLMLGVDMIAGAITGAIERKRLEEAIRDLENTLETFEPASKEFQRQIIRVTAILETHIEEEPPITW